MWAAGLRRSSTSRRSMRTFSSRGHCLPRPLPGNRAEACLASISTSDQDGAGRGHAAPKHLYRTSEGQIGMIPDRFTLSYQAQVQASLLTKADKAALSRLFAGDPINRKEVTKVMEDGRFVSRIGDKLVLWRKASDDRSEVLSIIDRSFLPAAE